MDETGSDPCPVAGTSCDFPTRVLVLLVSRNMKFSGRGPCLVMECSLVNIP